MITSSFPQPHPMETRAKKRLKVRFRYIRRSRDRISTLSRDIIHAQIFLRLDIKDIKRMSCLSKTWYSLSNSYPYLDFHLSPPGETIYDYTRTPNQQDTNNFLNYALQTLQRFYKLSNDSTDNQIIRRLAIPFRFYLETGPYLDTLINLVLQHGVEEFCLYIKNAPQASRRRPSMTCYELPPLFFSHPNSITKVARLEGCSLLRSFLTPNPNPHPNLLLKTLYFARVLIDDTVLSSIISCCPLIEELSLYNCMGIMTCLRISHLCRLRYLCFVDSFVNRFRDVEIDSPSLQLLHISGCFKVRIIGYYPVLTELTLWHIREIDLEDLLPKLLLLRTLDLIEIPCFTKLKLSSHTLNRLHISRCPNLVSLYINDAPSLLSVTFNNDYIQNPSAALPDVVVSSSSIQWVAIISYTSRTFEDFLLELQSFVSKIKKTKILDIYIQKSVESISFEKLKYKGFQPIVDNIDNLKIDYENFESGYLLVLDALLWTCHPQTLSIRLGMHINNYAVRMIFETIIWGHRHGWSSFTAFRRNWLLIHLKDVMYVSKDGTETRLTIDATSKLSNFDQYYPRSKLGCFDYPEIKFIFKW